MSCDVVIGDDCSIKHGETIELDLAYRNEDGTPIDLSGATVSVVSANPSSIQQDASLQVTDAPGGKVRFQLLRAGASKLRPGRVNRFRVLAVLSPSSDISTPDIWIQVT